MERQLSLLDRPHDWQLDDTTRALGRQGVAEARASLRAALARAAQAPATPHRQAA